MRTRLLLCRAALSGLALASAATVPLSGALALTVLHSFGTQDDGNQPMGDLKFDSAGNLYGTTKYGGVSDPHCEYPSCGTVFRIATDGAETILHSFSSEDGSNPSSGVIVAHTGDIYGVAGGGANLRGVLYHIAPGGTFTILHNFSETDGTYPAGRPIRDPEGNFYGVTTFGGSNTGTEPCPYGCGVVYKLTPGGDYQVLYDFTGGADESGPISSLMRDRAGNLYGVTTPVHEYGYSGYGTVYKIAPDGTETTLHTFTGGSDGAAPLSALDRDKQGNLYGTTAIGGAGQRGVVFKLTPDGTFSVLHAFNGTDGYQPVGNLLRIDNDLYGVTYYGGATECTGGCGTVYKTAPDGTETVLHRFHNHRKRSSTFWPFAGLAERHGRLYGSTTRGGAHSGGVVFSLRK